ncbi:MAG: transporter substrate-binding domain-containing protein, partial [Magnetococcales bacterium]|nr:transporter substrate-binding domain-containing protein [Magnetococcales bacterium]
MAEEKRLTAHIRHRPPYLIVQGQYLGGSLKEILDLAAQRAGYRVDWQDVPFTKSIEALKTGEVDLVPRTVVTPERQQFVRFLPPIGYEQQEILFLTHKGQEKTIRNYDDLKNLRIGLKKGTAYFDRFNKDATLNKQPFAGDDYGLLKQFVSGTVDTVIILDRRAMDSALAGMGFTDYGYAQYRLIQNLELNYGFSRASSHPEAADALEQELQSMQAKGEVDSLLAQSFMGPVDAGAITPAESQWRAQTPGPFRVYYDENRPPFQFTRDQLPQGFAIDYMDLLATKMALPLKYIPSSGSDVQQRLRDNEVDVVLALPPEAGEQTSLVYTLPYPGSLTGMALPEKMTPLRDLLQKAMSRISTEEMKQLKEKWPAVFQQEANSNGASENASAQARLHLTPEETRWLRDHAKVRLAVATNNPPLEMMQDGKWTGLTADFMALLTKISGITLEPVPVVGGSDGSQMVEKQQADVASAFLFQEERRDPLRLTEGYITFPVVIVTRRDAAFISGLEDLAGLKVAVVRNGPEIRLLQKHHPQLQQVLFNTTAEALQAVNARQVDALVENLAKVSQALNQLQMDRLHIAAPTAYQTGLFLAVRPDWPELVSILQKALDQIGTREKNSIRNTWMAMQVQIGVDLKQLFAWGGAILLVILLIISFIVAWNRRLGREIVERKEAEAALEAAEERSRLLLESVGEGIFGVDQDGHFHFINPSGAALLGVTPEEIIGKRFCLLQHHDDFNGAACQKESCTLRQSILRQETSRCTDRHFLRMDGTPMPVEYSSRSITKNGIHMGTVVIFQDITERLKSEQRIRILSSAVEQSPVSIIITDPQARIEYVNPAFTRNSGYRPDEVLGQNPRLLKSGQMDEQVYKNLWETLLKGENWEGELLNRKKSGQLYWESTTISPILDQDKRVKHYLANKEDITLRKAAEEQLQKALNLISSSIQYASRIQRSILTPTDKLAETLPEHFVLWEPRDVVGGDMYWYRPWISGTLLLLGDCTGHGVPGAFITLIANGALDQALLETPPGDTATLLQRMHQLIQAALGQDHQEGASNDGLELGACYLDPYQPNLTFSGARFSLFVMEETQVQEIKGVKSGLGYRGVDWNVEFKNHEVPLNPDWCYYMTS